MSIKDDVRHAVHMMSRWDKVKVVGINLIGGCFGPWGSVASILWTVGFVAGKSKEVDIHDPEILLLVMDAHKHLEKK